MITDHAIVEREGFKVPLIGVSPDAVLETCDLCHDEFPLRDVQIVDGTFCLCPKCRKEDGQ